MLNYCKSSKNINPDIILNYSVLDISNTELDKTYPTLYKLTKIAINYIIQTYEQFNYLINKQIELSLVITNNFNIKLINFKWRKLMKVTNVLSMSLMTPEDAKINPIILLGDIIISLEKTQEEALLLGINYTDHLIRLFIHGIVHIFGFDHKNEEDALTMKYIEDKILKLFNKKISPLINNYWENSEKSR